MKKDLSKNILGKIKKEKIQPISKWSFLLKKSSIWSLFGISVILGGFAFGSILAQISSTEWNIRHQITDSFMFFVFMTLPYLWIIFMLGFGALAYYYLRRTSKGYRYSTIIVVNSSLLISVLFGSALYASGLSTKFEHAFQEKSPLYREVLDRRVKLWKNPEKGLLAGKFIKHIDEENIEIIDLRKRIWTVNIAEVVVKKELPLRSNLPVKIIGEKKENQIFIAKEIRLWNKNKVLKCDTEKPDEPCLKPPRHFPKKVKENFQLPRSNDWRHEKR